MADCGLLKKAIAASSPRHSRESGNPDHCAVGRILDSRFRGNDKATFIAALLPAASADGLADAVQGVADFVERRRVRKAQEPFAVFPERRPGERRHAALVE